MKEAYLEFLAFFRKFLGVSYTTYNTDLGAIVWGTEAVGYHDGGFPVLASMERDSPHEQPDKLLALGESFGRVLLDLLSALPEQV